MVSSSSSRTTLWSVLRCARPSPLTLPATGNHCQSGPNHPAKLAEAHARDRAHEPVLSRDGVRRMESSQKQASSFSSFFKKPKKEADAPI